MALDCWPACGPWCSCDEATGQCVPRPFVRNAVRLRCVNASLVADNRYVHGTPQQFDVQANNIPVPDTERTFHLISQPWGIADAFSLATYDDDWQVRPAFLVRTAQTLVRDSGFLEQMAAAGSNSKVCLASSPVGGWTNDMPEQETAFFRKNGGGAVETGDLVSIRVADGFGRSYFWRVTPLGTLIADALSPFQPNTSFVVEFLEVMPGIGVRPQATACQRCSRVIGKVVDGSKGIASADVRTRNGSLDGVPFEFRASTDDNGDFQLAMFRDGAERTCVPAGAIGLDVLADRFQRPAGLSVTVQLSGTTSVVVPLEPTVVRGDVVGCDDQPLRNDRRFVLLQETSGQLLSMRLSPQGSFSFSRVKHEPVFIRLSGEMTGLSEVVPPEGLTVTLKVCAEGCLKIAGTVIDADDPSRKVGGALVSVAPAQGGTAIWATTAADGTYRIEQCLRPPGNWIAVAEGPAGSDYLADTESVQVAPGDNGTRTVDFQLPKDMVVERNLVIWNTGTPDNIGQLRPGDPDPHWGFFSGPQGAPAAPGLVLVDQVPQGYFQPTNAAWIWQNPQGDAPQGVAFTFRQVIDLTGFDPATVVVSGQWGVDNMGEIRLNGVVPQSAAGSVFQLSGDDVDNFGTPHPFRIASGFVPGLNFLDVVAINAPGGTPNPGGLCVFGTSISGQPL